MSPSKKKSVPSYPKVIETYQPPDWELTRFASPEPSTFNGIVRIRRYRITVELIEEPIEVLRERLKKLWRESEPNFHTRHPMRKVGEEIGMDVASELLSIEQGIDYKRSR